MINARLTNATKMAAFGFSLSDRWLRGVDLNHRPLGYECNRQQNLKTLRGAKSNALLLAGIK